MSEATMVLVPEEYQNGVAAFNTVNEAQAFAKELNKKTGFQHKVVVDNHAGCAVVECTNKPIYAFADGAESMTFEEYEQSYAHLRKILFAEGTLTSQERDVLEHENPLDVDISKWNIVYCKTIIPEEEETMFDFEVTVRVMIDKESKKFGKSLNAFLLRHDAEDKFDRKAYFLLIMFPSGLQDFEGNELAENDVLYTSENNQITVHSIGFEVPIDFEDMCDNENCRISLRYSQEFYPRMFGVGAALFRRCWTHKESNTTCEHYTAKNLKKTLWSDEDRKKLNGNTEDNGVAFQMEALPIMGVIMVCVMLIICLLYRAWQSS